MLTQAQQTQKMQARFTIRDAVRDIAITDLAPIIAEALLVHHKPEVVEWVGNIIGREAHMAGRA